MVTDLFTFQTFGISDVGSVRSNNEDAWIIQLDPLILIVADGIGGNNAGEIASQEAVTNLRDGIAALFQQYGSILTPLQLAVEIQSILIRINSWIHYLSSQDNSLKGMGTTLSCLVQCGDKYVTGHVGDSRIYRYRKVLSQLTIDHSLREDLFAKGKLSARQMLHFPHKHIITRTIGTKPKVKPEIRIGSYRKGDIFMLCSDGLSDHVSYSKLSNILENTSTDLETSCSYLIDLAKGNGSHDNITILMCKVC